MIVSLMTSDLVVVCLMTSMTKRNPISSAMLSFFVNSSHSRVYFRLFANVSGVCEDGAGPARPGADRPQPPPLPPPRRQENHMGLYLTSLRYTTFFSFFLGLLLRCWIDFLAYMPKQLMPGNFFIFSRVFFMCYHVIVF